MPGDVLLRDVIETDLPIFYENENDPEANQMAAFNPRGREAFMAHWKKIMVDRFNILKTILADGRVAGNIAVFGPADHREVGYWIGKEYWGQGVATRALKAMVEDVAERPLYAHVAKHNLGSRRVAEKCGFVLYGDGYTTFEGRQVEDYVLVLGGEDSG